MSAARPLPQGAASASGAPTPHETPEPQGAPERTLLDDLVEAPERFTIGTALRVAQAGVGDGNVSLRAPDATRIAATPVTAVHRDGVAIALETPVTALTGPLGPLPPAYGEMVDRQRRARAHGLGAFLDLFGGRLLRLFVAAGEKYRLAPLVRWHGLSGANGLARAMLSLAGMGEARVAARNGLGDAAVLRHAGLLANRVRSAAALEATLAERTGLPVRVEQFRPRWLDLSDTDRTRLGPGARLGVNTSAGLRVRDRQGLFRIVVGPVGYRDYRSLAPGTSRLADLMAWTRLFAGVGLDFEVQVVLARTDVPQTRLGGAEAEEAEAGEGGAALGWNTWVRQAPAAHDAGDTVLRPTGTEGIVVEEVR